MNPVLQLIASLVLAAGNEPAWEDTPDMSMEGIGDVCMALVVFAEARGEPITGQMAVAEVLKNRLKDLELGADGCTVAEASDQFHGWRDWPYPRQPEKMDSRGWKIAQEAVAAVMSHNMDLGPCKGSKYFYSGNSRPDWAEKKIETCVIGAHTFLRDQQANETEQTARERRGDAGLQQHPEHDGEAAKPDQQPQTARNPAEAPFAEGNGT